MGEIDRLEEQVRRDMAEIGQPMSIRSAASIASQYQRLGHSLPVDETVAIVRKVAAEMRFTVF
ncbi:hypothetical protein [Novosphingobium kaempferiae]|uniref:hypothetical protein n=1 Tax=Novosphingobium kaempferiae TaxID=2896849 RepID=UPI001E4097AD|nr:hypothetical protein [Novosphingobium kaempferiae]